MYTTTGSDKTLFYVEACYPVKNLNYTLPALAAMFLLPAFAVLS
jgi:hypothetical protein